jgi:hypothetical protein
VGHNGLRSYREEQMKDGKFGLRAFGLAIVAALGLMAFSAVTAQAENLTDGGKAALFEILKSNTLVKGATFTGEIENWTDGLKHGFLLVKDFNLSILCSDLTFQGAIFLDDKEALASIKFSECDAFNLAGTEKLTACSIISQAEGGEKRVILSSGIALPRKHDTKSYLLVHPHPGGALLGTIYFEKEKGCPLPLKNPVAGLFIAELAKKEAIEHLITSNEAIQTLLLGGVSLLYGAHPAVIDGNVKGVKLTGPHTGCSFGVV